MADDEFNIEEHFREMRRSHSKMDDEFRKLLAEPCQRTPVVGDRVVVATGLLNMGHLWIREEGFVTEVGDTSVCVAFNRYGKVELKWVHPVLITDVLPPISAALEAFEAAERLKKGDQNER